MAMEYPEGESRRGKARVRAFADIVTGALKSRGKEAVPVEVRRFSDETRVALGKEGYVIDTLTGQSIASFRKAERNFSTWWHKDYPKFEAITSMQSEVAIKPDQLFIPESNKKTLAQQEEMINQFSQELSRRIPGVAAVMGGVADYVNLAFTHLDVTNEYLLNERFARTNTPTIGDSVAVVGKFFRVSGLGVGHCGRDSGYDPFVFAIPLVIPKS